MTEGAEMKIARFPDSSCSSLEKGESSSCSDINIIMPTRILSRQLLDTPYSYQLCFALMFVCTSLELITRHDKQKEGENFTDAGI